MGSAAADDAMACPIARSRDVVGERWTLLIVRDLLVGPKRYQDLLLGLPGVGTNLLAARLRELETTNILERTLLPPPAGSTVYQLTEQGLALQPAIMALARWGATFLGPPRETDVLPFSHRRSRGRPAQDRAWSTGPGAVHPNLPRGPGCLKNGSKPS
jgi:DNA-binding HxlR family transcriptional regulator